MNAVLAVVRSKKGLAVIAAALTGLAGYLTGSETILQAAQAVVSAFTGS